MGTLLLIGSLVATVMTARRRGINPLSGWGTILILFVVYYFLMYEAVYLVHSLVTAFIQSPLGPLTVCLLLLAGLGLIAYCVRKRISAAGGPFKPF